MRVATSRSKGRMVGMAFDHHSDSRCRICAMRGVRTRRIRATASDLGCGCRVWSNHPRVEPRFTVVPSLTDKTDDAVSRL